MLVRAPYSMLVNGMEYNTSRHSIINVIDIVSMVNYILLGTGLEANQICAADLNSDNIINVIDIVSIVNIILNQ